MLKFSFSQSFLLFLVVLTTNKFYMSIKSLALMEKKSCSDTEPHNVSIEHVQIFQIKRRKSSLFITWCLDTYDHRLRRLLLVCASFKEEKLRSSSMLEQSQNVAIGF